MTDTNKTEGDPQDSWRVELPDRSSTYNPPLKEDVYSPSSTGLASPGLESVLTVNTTEKEIAIHLCPDQDVHPKEVVPPKKIRSRTTWLLWILVAILCALIGLGVGLGVGLTRKGSNDTQTTPASAPSNSSYPARPSYYSTTGAFNGSGIALASESFSSGGHGSIVMYFQHHSGEIRSTQLSSDGSWQGGSYSEIVAIDAKNATPIAAVAYARNNTAAWHIFYISVNNTVKEVINNNNTNVWLPGPINNLNLQAMDDPNAGLEACWYGSFYSDVAYNHSPVPGLTNVTGDSSDQTVGIHLWYASSSISFNSVGWTYGDNTWTQQQTFDGYNGHAGVGCYSWGPGSDTYVFMVNLQNEINILWKDLNTTLQSNSTHPINVWTKSPVSIPVFQNSSMGYTNYLYAQNPDLTISGFNLTFAAENTSIPTDETFVINGAKGLPGTHLSVTALPDSSGGNSLLAFYQTNGSDITEFVRDLDQGQWTSSSVPIPNQ